MPLKEETLKEIQHLIESSETAEKFLQTINCLTQKERNKFFPLITTLTKISINDKYDYDDREFCKNVLNDIVELFVMLCVRNRPERVIWFK